MGTDDAPTSGFWSPTNLTGTDTLKVSEYQYDGGVVGDGNLTQQTSFTNDAGSTPDRVAQMHYDWRNRLVATKEGVQGTEATTVNRPIYYTDYDNLNRPTYQYLFDGDTVTISSTSGVPNQPSSGNLRGQSRAEYDEQGRVFRTQVYSVDQSTGTVGNALQSNTWYDKRGNAIKTAALGGLVTKMQYDGAGRVTKTFAADGGGDPAAGATSNWDHADDVTGDNVLEQAEYTYDANGNVTLVTSRQRFHDATETGELGTPASVSPVAKARVSYQAMYYDAAGRTTAGLDVGTNGGSAYTRPGTVPTRSDSELVTSYTYDAAGRLQDVTDPRAIVARSEYDLLGRTTKSIAAYVNGTADAADDQTTLYAYDGADHLVTLTADLPSGQDDQVTQYVYGVTTGGGSDINSNDLLLEVRYPDKSTGAAGTADTDKQRYTYNALGGIKTLTDQNGTVHAYDYDVLGRLTHDRVTTLGTGVDSSIRRISFTYDTAGRPEKSTSYDNATVGSGAAKNGTSRAYNGLGQLTAEGQNHAGEAVSFSSGSTRAVLYAYDTTSSGGSLSKSSRLTSMTYPNGRVLTYNYTGSTLDDSISRLTSISDSSATLESYSYLGAGTVVERKHVQPGIDLTYVKQGAEGNGEAGDPYAGLDRFGRVVDQRWHKTSDASSVDRFKYAYDRNGNRLYKENTLTAALSELYSASDDIVTNNVYDKLNRLTGFQRGTLTDAGSNNTGKLDTVATATRTQDWDLDALGNWGDTTGSAANAVGDGTTTQQRKHNSRNQLTAYDADGAGGNAETTLAYDSAGSMTTDESGQTFTYDAWGRVAAVNSTGIVYKNDALGRRIAETKGGVTTDLYYSPGWQLIEERVGSNVRAQNVWSSVYIDALVLRDDLASPDGQLDTSFSSDGVVTTDLGSSDVGVAVAIDSQGRIVVAGYRYSTADWAAVRYTSTGALDTTFGGGDGIAIIEFNAGALGGSDLAFAVAIDASDNIVLGGRAGDNFAAARLLGSDGSLDNGFGGDGMVTVDVNVGGGDGAQGVAVDALGRIVLAGYVGSLFGVVRLESDGDLDNTFSADGMLTTDFGTGTDAGKAVAIQPDGLIVVAGTSNGQFAAARYEADGDLDPTFDTDGMVLVDVPGTGDVAYALALQPDGKIVLAGVAQQPGIGNHDVVLARLTAAGALDTTFDGDGKVTTDFGTGGTTTNDFGRSVAVAAGGKLVITGFTGSSSAAEDLLVARYNADGSLDPTFDGDGRRVIDVGLTTSLGSITANDRGNGVVVDSQGRIVIGGASGSAWSFAALRFGGPGRTVRLYPMQDANFNTTAVADAAGTVVERYIYDAYGAFTVLNPDGTADPDGVRDVDMSFLFQGKRWEANSGMYHFNNRDLDPVLGRWNREDPLGYIEGLNKYQSHESSPATKVDPFGLMTPEQTPAVSFFVYVAAWLGAGLVDSIFLRSRVVPDVITSGPTSCPEGQSLYYKSVVVVEDYAELDTQVWVFHLMPFAYVQRQDYSLTFTVVNACCPNRSSVTKGAPTVVNVLGALNRTVIETWTSTTVVKTRLMQTITTVTATCSGEVACGANPDSSEA